MRGLESHDDVRIFLRERGSRFWVHVLNVLFDSAAAHSIADDVDKREDSRLRTINYAVFKVWKVFPAGTAGIDDSRHAAPKGKTVRIDAIVAVVGAPESGPCIVMRVNIQQARSDKHPFDGDNFCRGRVWYVVFHSSNLVIANSNVSNGLNSVVGINDIAPFEDQVVFRRGFLGKQRDWKQ